MTSLMCKTWLGIKNILTLKGFSEGLRTGRMCSSCTENPAQVTTLQKNAEGGAG